MGTMTAYELAEKSGVVYSTLVPLLRGDRDFSVTRLLQITEALGVNIEELLVGTYSQKQPRNIPNTAQAKYLAVFITNNKSTRCFVRNIKTNEEKGSVAPYTVYCCDTPNNTISAIKSHLDKLIDDKNLNYQEVAVYTSSLAYEHIQAVPRLKKEGSRHFNCFMLEPDWKTSHHALFPNQNGILITINDGFVISYSNNKSQTIHKLQGYGFPASDHAGAIWLGCQAIKHTIDVVEGLAERTMLSDSILPTYHSDLNTLASTLYDNARMVYLEAATIVISLFSKKDKSFQLVEESFQNIWNYIKRIDHLTDKKLPIKLSGEFAYVYDSFLPDARFKGSRFRHENAENQYGINRLTNILKLK